MLLFRNLDDGVQIAVTRIETGWPCLTIEMVSPRCGSGASAICTKPLFVEPSLNCAFTRYVIEPLSNIQRHALRSELSRDAKQSVRIGTRAARPFPTQKFQLVRLLRFLMRRTAGLGLASASTRSASSLARRKARSFAVLASSAALSAATICLTRLVRASAVTEGFAALPRDRMASRSGDLFMRRSVAESELRAAATFCCRSLLDCQPALRLAAFEPRASG
jgi:hypothetical protein